MTNINQTNPTRTTTRTHNTARTVATTELRLRINIADLHELLNTLNEHTATTLSPDDHIDLGAYRDRIDQLASTQHDLAHSVERLTALIDAGADTLLISIGRAIIDTLERILEAANAHATALNDGA